MAKIGFQFHSDVCETAKYIIDIVKENDLKVAIVQNYPDFEYSIVDSCKIELDMVIKAQEILLFVLQPKQIKDNYLEFIRTNEGCLSIRFGIQNDTMLRESIIGGIAENDSLAFWRKIISKYKKTMYKGAWILDENSGVKRYYKDHRYSQGAKKMYGNGISIYAIAGNCKYVLEPINE